MTVLTAVVVGLSLRASDTGHQHTAAGATAGIVKAAPRNTAASTAPATKTPATPKAHASHQPASTPASRSRTSITVNGGVADTMYGPVQVQITVRGARIVRAHAIDYPHGGGRDQQINSGAIPALDQETLQAQSARIDTVSGATYTSDGYRRSLQSALDAAHRIP